MFIWKYDITTLINQLQGYLQYIAEKALTNFSTFSEKYVIQLQIFQQIHFYLISA